ncbi:pilin [Halomonas sp.]|uniref:pilin n=1 Tax=unclassified Halomonas TaxID=2609666 RepID=UPI003F93B962
MDKHSGKIKGDEDGFTLIELMIVIAIVGVLMAVAVPQYGNYLDKASLTACEGELASYRSMALVNYSLSKTAQSDSAISDDFSFQACDISTDSYKQELFEAFTSNDVNKNVSGITSTRGGIINIEAGKIVVVGT